MTRTTQHGYPILASRAKDDGEIIIAFRANHNAHPYVTWFMRPDGVCSSGEYCFTFEEAEKSMNARARGL